MAEITLNIPDVYIDMLLASFTKGTDTDLVLSARGSHDNEDGSDFSGSAHTRIEVQGEEEGNLAFGKRYIIGLLILQLMMTEQATADEIRNLAIAAVPPATIDIPEGIVT